MVLQCERINSRQTKMFRHVPTGWKLILLTSLWMLLGCDGDLLDGNQLTTKINDIVNNYLAATLMQEEYDKLTYTSNPLDGPALIQEMSTSLRSKFQSYVTALTNLKTSIEQNYGSFSSQGSAKDCCNSAGLEYNSQFKGQVGMNDYCHMISGSADMSRKLPSSSVFETMKTNLNSNPELKWQYFGSEEGVLINYPKIKQSSCTSYDPRYRPWYVETATPRPKDVVIVLDKSGSMTSKYNGKTYMDIAIDAAVTVLDTLNPNDRVAVTAFSSNAGGPSGSSETSTCYQNEMALATPQNIKYLTSYVKSIRAGGGTYYAKALNKAFDYIEASATTEGEGTDKVILFLTDGVPSDTSTTILATIKTRNELLSNSVVIMTFGIGSAVASSTILPSMSQQINNDPSKGTIRKPDYKAISNLDNLRSDMASFYNFFSSSEVIVDPIFSVPYEDGFGIGLVTSACLPVYSGGLKGVTCVDIPIAELFEDITYFKQGELSYAFIVDGRGRTLTHPLLPRPKDAKDDPIFVYIGDLETSTNVEDVVEGMKNGSSGYKQVNSNRVLAKGAVKREGVLVKENVNSRYYWYPIGFGNFSMCIVVADSDRQASLSSLTPSSGMFLYHRLDLKKSGTLCKHFRRLARKDTTTVMLTANAFKDPYQYFQRNDTLNDVNTYQNYFNGFSNTVTPKVKESVRNAVVASSKVHNFWAGESSASSFSYTIWRAIGTVEGTMRVYPGVQLAKDYDHQLRPWYKRTLANKGMLTISSPYLDAWGAGFVMTIAKPIYEGRANNIHSTSDQVVAVMSADVSIYYMYSLIHMTFANCNDSRYSCFLVDNSGLLVMHEDFVSVPSGEPVIESVPLLAKEPAIAYSLITNGFMVRKACIDFANLTNRYHWSVSISSKASNSNPFYELVEVPGTNLFVGIKSKISSSSGCSAHCPHNGMKDFKCDLSGQCQCPCYYNTKLQYCNNTFLDSWPPCRPIVPDVTSVKLEVNSTTTQSMCYNPQCSSATSNLTCYNKVGCSWCHRDNNDADLGSQAYCADHEVCYYGKVGQAGPYGGNGNSNDDKPKDEDNGPLIGGIIAAVVVTFLIVSYCVYKKHYSRTNRPAASHGPSANQETHHRMPSLNDQVPQSSGATTDPQPHNPAYPPPQYPPPSYAQLDHRPFSGQANQAFQSASAPPPAAYEMGAGPLPPKF